MGFGLTVEGTARMLVGLRVGGVGVVVYGDGVVYVEVVVHRTEGHRTEGKSVLVLSLMYREDERRVMG